MEEFIGTDECTVYYGLRADEPERGGYVPLRKVNIHPAYPLRAFGVDLQGVYSILDAQELTPPDFFWKRLYDAVVARMGGASWEGSLTRLERQLLFAGRTRANCFMCFFQRRYEYLWLYETHPDLFAQAEALEKEDYSFQHGFFLKELHSEDRRVDIFQARVRDVCKAIHAKRQGSLFGESCDNDIALVSCGLLCGK
jgi:hypothetical protein